MVITINGISKYRYIWCVGNMYKGVHIRDIGHITFYIYIRYCKCSKTYIFIKNTINIILYSDFKLYLIIKIQVL